MKGRTSRKVVGLGIITCLAIATSMIVSEVKGDEPQGPFHFIYGFGLYNGTVPAAYCLVNITNTDRGETNFTMTDEYGFYQFNCGSFAGPNWLPGENLIITIYGNSSQCWTNWTGSTNGVVPDVNAYYNVTLETWLDPYDVGTEAINYPANGASLCPDPLSYIVNATVENYGATYTHTFPVELHIYDSGMTEVFTDSVIVTLAPGAQTYVEFSPWIPADATEDYTIVVTTAMTCPNHDYIPSTDAKSIDVHVDQRVIDMQVDKTVWNYTHWDHEVTVPTVPYTVTFNISIHNNGECSYLSNIAVVDTLGSGLVYVPGSSTLNGIPIGDPSIAGNQLTWDSTVLGTAPPFYLDYCEWLYLEFQADVTEWGTTVNDATVVADVFADPDFQYYITDTTEYTPTVVIVSDSTPPVTTLSYGDPNCIGDYIFITSATPLTLDAVDDVTGVAYTVYYIDAGTPVTVYDNGAGDDNPNIGEITTTFYMTGTDGVHTVYYHSVDYAGNVETTNSQEYFLDNTGPDITIEVTGPQCGQYVTSETTFELGAEDAGSGTFRDVIFYEGFEGGSIPPGWTQVQYSGTGMWMVSPYPDLYDPPGTGAYFAEADDDDVIADYDVGLFTPAIDLRGWENIYLEFDRNFQDFAGYGQAAVNVYSGGTGPGNFEEQLLYLTNDDPSSGVHTVLGPIDPSTYADPSQVYFEFWYTDDGYYSAWKFAIDDVTLTGEWVGIAEIYYRVWYNGTWTDWYLYEEPFNLTGDCQHIIQAYSEDCLGNVGLENFTFYVDNTPPVVEKIITGPGLFNYTWITSETLFTLNATDPEGGVVVAPMQTTIISEDFEGAFPPAGWTVIGPLWNRNDYWGRTNYAGGDGYCADADSDAYGTGGDSELWTPSFSLAGYSAATLEFVASYNYLYNDYADVDISTDGGATWINLLHWAEDHDAYGPGEEVTIDLTPYVGNSNVIIRWHYYAPGWDWWYEIDQVRITAEGGGAQPCASGVSATYYRIWYNGTWTEPILYEEPFTLEGHCMHMIEFWAVDCVGNEGEHTIQTHYLDESVPESWMTIDQEINMDIWQDYITPYTEFNIFASTLGCNNTTAPYVIFFKIRGPEGSKFFYNGNYFNCNGTWVRGYNSTPISFQIRDEDGYAPTGAYTVTFYAQNLVTGENGPQHEETFIIDITPPTTTLLFDGTYYIPADREDVVYILPSTIMTFTADDGKDYEGASGVKLIKYKIDDGHWKIYEDGDEITIDEPGEHTLYYYAKDWIDNSGDVIIKTVVVDATAPQTNIGFNGEIFDDGEKVVITPETSVYLTSIDSGAGVSKIYYIVDGTQKEYTSPFELTPGEHVIGYYAEDNLGNGELISYSTVVVDNIAPIISVEKPHEKYIYIGGREILPLFGNSQIDVVVIGAVSIKASAEDASTVVKMELYIDGEKQFEENGANLNWQWDRTAFWMHTIEIRAYDYFGHSSSTTIKALVFNL